MKKKKELKDRLDYYYYKQAEIEIIFAKNKKNNIPNPRNLLTDALEICASISELEWVLN